VRLIQQPIPARGTPLLIRSPEIQRLLARLSSLHSGLTGLCLALLLLASASALHASTKNNKPAGEQKKQTEHKDNKKNESQKDSNALIVSAKEAFQKGRLPELERLMVRTQGHLLAAWPDYWRLKLLLGMPGVDAKAMKAHVEGFVGRHSKHPLKENAQRDWVNALIAKNLWEDASKALAMLPDTLSGPQIACAKAKLGMLPVDNPFEKGQFASLAIGQETSDACIGLVDQLAKDEQVSLAYLRQRTRWAAQVGSDSSHGRYIELLRTQAKVQDTHSRGPDPVKTETLLGEILKTARVNSLSSLQSYKNHRKSLTPDQAHYAAFAVGAALWQRSHNESWTMMLEGWISLAQQPSFALQIAAREAIRRYEWPRLLEIIAAMRESDQVEPTWQYWKAVGLRETQNKAAAEAILVNLRDDFGFYGMLARESLGSTIKIPAPAAVTLTPADRQRLDKDQSLARSYALVRAGLRGEAVMEWSAAMRDRSDTELIQAALHARSAGFYDRMIAAADRTRQEHDFSLRFPVPFKETVLPAAKENSIDPWWVLGLIRQESRFIPDIKSSVGASGLMQIMPATGKMLAKNSGMKNVASLHLTDVNLNVKLGTTYMRQLHERFGGSALLASAAYNAGPSRAVSWRAALPQRIDGAAFAESIPFSETRDYVKRVLANAVLYHAVHNGGVVPSLRQLLGEVLPD